MRVRLASIVLPVHNQADHIESALQDFASSLSQLDFPCEIIPVVNGVRRDRSFEICKEMESRWPMIHTLAIEQGGWGVAVRAGLGAAQGDLLCYSNSARTIGEDLLLLVLYGSIHTDAVIKASRKIRENWKRRLGSLLYNLECRALFDLPYWDVNGTPKVFHRNLSKLLELKRNDDLIDLEFNAICRTAGYPVLEVPILSTTRRSGRSTTGLKSAYRMYAGALELRRELLNR